MGSWKGRSERPSSRLSHALPQIVASATALFLSFYSAFRQGSWKETAALSYLFALGVLRLVVGSSAWRATVYHHVNAVAFALTVLDAAQSLLPLAIIGSNSTPSPIEKFKLVSLVAVLLVALVTPRLPQHKKPVLEDAGLDLPGIASPEQTSSWFSCCVSYGWLTSVILRGFSRDLSIEDLPPLPAYDNPMLWLNRVIKARLQGGKTLKALICVFKQDIRVIVLWAALTAVVEYTAPFAMFHLLAYLENPQSDRTVVHPFVWIALLFLGPMARSICYQRAIFWSTRLLVRVKATVIQEVYLRMLWSRANDSLNDERYRPYRDAAPDTTPDVPLDFPAPNSIKTESLVSYDADAISSASDMFYAFTASAVSTAIAMTFLYQLLGWPSLLGVMVLIILTPLPALFSRRLSRMHRHVMEATDFRLSKISEYLHSVRTLKYFAWESTVSEAINKIRVTEQQRIWRRNLASMLVSMTGDMLSLVSLLAMFSSLVLFTDRPMRAPMAFTSLAITETLRSQYVWLSKVAQWVAQGRESIQRVDRFFDSTVEQKRHPDGPPEFVNATFEVSQTANFRLRNLSISFRERALNIITGPTGSGKTSLLLSLLGETTLESGTVTCPADVAYVPQNAWLQNSTVRQNILFYAPYDESRYNAIINACDLVSDLSLLPLGDLTHVGEQGSALSGGQKQRISLARALYSSASTLLLDDIFSALDIHTTSRIYEKCFASGMLADRTIIIVTQLAAAVADADMLVVLDHGTTRLFEIRDKIIPQDALEDILVNVEEEETAASMSSDSTPGLSYDEYDSQVQSTQLVKATTDSGEIEHLEERASGRVPRTMSKSHRIT